MTEEEYKEGENLKLKKHKVVWMGIKYEVDKNT
jgi:hypothetical protein